MLDLMRKHAASWFIKILLGAIVVVFVFWGVGSFRSYQEARVAVVNGETITQNEYAQVYDSLLEMYRNQFKNVLDADTLRSLNLPQQALDRLIDRKLLLQEAEKLGFVVTDEQLARRIAAFPAFQRGDGFDAKIYERTLAHLRTTPEQFEASQREDLLLDKLMGFMTVGAKVTEAEVQQWYEWNGKQVDIQYVAFEPLRYTDVDAPEQEVKRYYDKHRQQYETDPEVKVSYLFFDPAAYTDGVKIGDDAIADYYDMHQDDFEIPPTVEARHILIRLAPDALAEQIEAAKEKALDIQKKALAGEDFASLAEKYSEDTTKDNGGYLGTFSRESMVKPFADKAFSMEPGQISEPVRTQFGWHIIKVEAVNPARTRSLEEAAEEIRNKLVQEAASNLAYQASLGAYDASLGAGDLARAAETKGISLKTTDFFSDQGPKEGIRSKSRFAEEAFKLKENEFSEVLELPEGFYLLQVQEKKPATIPEFDEVKDRVREDVIAQLQREKARSDAEALLAQVKAGNPLSEAAKGFGLSPKNTGYFKRAGAIPQIGYEPSVSAAAFLLTEAKPLPDTALEGRKDFFVIHLAGVKPPPPEGFAAEKENIEKNLLRSKEQQIVEAWRTALRERATITIQERYRNP